MKSGRVCWALLMLFTLAMLLVGRSYYIANKRPPTFDDAWYLDTSFHFYEQLTRGSVVDFVKAYAGSFRTKAPLASVLPLPFYLLLGERYQSAMLVNMTFIVISSVYLFLLGRRWFSPAAGLAAAVFYQTMPLAYGLSRVFMPDYGLAALVVVWVYYLESSEGFSRGKMSFLLGVILGLGLLMKVLFPAYIAGPLLYVLWKRRPGASALITIALPALLLASTWYAFHLRDVFLYAWQAGYGEIGEQYGSTVAGGWLVTLINQGISAYYAGALLLLGVAALAAAGGKFEWSESASILAGWLVVPLLMIGTGRNREIRFVLPVLPAFALLLAAAISRVVRRPIAQIAATAALAVFPLRLFAALSYPPALGHFHLHPTMIGPFILFSRELGWAEPPSRAGQWDQQRILEAIRQLEPPAANPRHVIVGVEHRYLNANLLAYLNRVPNYSLVLDSFGYAESSVERAVERIYRTDARYLVMAEGFHSHELVATFNQVNAAIQEQLDRGDLPFRRRASVALTEKIKAVIYERDEPWTQFAAGAPAEKPARAIAADFAGGPRFLGYDAKQTSPHVWQVSYYWTVAHPIGEDYRVNIEWLDGGGRVMLAQDHYVGRGRHPFYEWGAGEIVRQTTLAYLPGDGPIAGRLWLTRWGYGDGEQIPDPKELIHRSVVPLRLDP